MPRKKPVQPEEKRIYTIVALTVDVKKRANSKITRRIRMEPGRITAQHGHVISRMRMLEIEKLGVDPITTICLSVRNSKELDKVQRELCNHFGCMYAFFDDNLDFYGTHLGVKTAICIPKPVFKEGLDHIIGHLPLFGAE